MCTKFQVDWISTSSKTTSTINFITRSRTNGQTRKHNAHKWSIKIVRLVTYLPTFESSHMGFYCTTILKVTIFSDVFLYIKSVEKIYMKLADQGLFSRLRILDACWNFQFWIMHKDGPLTGWEQHSKWG